MVKEKKAKKKEEKRKTITDIKMLKYLTNLS